MERLFEAVATLRHGFGANCNTNVDAATHYLVGDVLDSFEPGRAEAVYGGSTGCGGVPGCEGGSAGDVGGFPIGNLVLCQ